MTYGSNKHTQRLPGWKHARKLTINTQEEAHKEEEGGGEQARGDLAEWGQRPHASCSDPINRLE